MAKNGNKRPASRQQAGFQAPAVNLLQKSEKPVAVALVIVGILLLVFAARGDLWFDEILSFQWANNAGSIADLLRLFRHDNNHPLNSAWLYLLGEHHAPVLYRIPSIAAGGVSLLLLYELGRHICPKLALLPLALATFSFPLLLYGSEARGFSVAVAASLGCVLLLSKYEAKPFAAVGFWFLSVAGMLSHGSFLIVLLALFIWFLARAAIIKENRVATLRSLSVWFTIPSLAAVAHYWYFLRQMLVAGGPEYSFLQVASQFYGYLLGAPISGSAGLISIFAGVGILLAGIVLARKPAPLPAVFFTCLMLIAPSVSLLAGRSEFLYFRYFLVLVPFYYLLLGVLGCFALKKWPKSAPFALAVALLFFFLGQAPRIGELLLYGRGGYSAALQKISATPAENKMLISDHDMRNGMIVEFHRRRSPKLQPIRYIPEWEFEAELREMPSWILTHQIDTDAAPAPSAMDFGRQPYALVAQYQTAPVSGFRWFLYQKIDSHYENRARSSKP